MKRRELIKGDCAGQTIGLALGGPYEFRFSGIWIQDYQPLYAKSADLSCFEL